MAPAGGGLARKSEKLRQLKVICRANATRMAMPQSNERKMSMRVLMAISLERSNPEETS